MLECYTGNVVSLSQFRAYESVIHDEDCTKVYALALITVPACEDVSNKS